MIGSFGDIVFNVSSEQVITFTNAVSKHSAKYSEHSIAGRKGLLEFTGYSPVTLTIQIRFDHSLGVNPYGELRTLRKMFQRKKAYFFIVNDAPICDNKFVIEGYEEELERFAAGGELLSATVNLTLKEYITIDEED